MTNIVLYKMYHGFTTLTDHDKKFTLIRSGRFVYCTTNELIFFLPSSTGVHWSLGSSTRRLSKVALTVSQFN